MKRFGHVQVVDPRLGRIGRAEQLGLGDLGRELRLVAELDGLSRADVDAAGHGPALVEQVGATGALLRDVEVLVEEEGVVGAGEHALAAAGALLRVDDDQAVFTLVDGALDRAGLQAGGVGAVLARHRHVVQLDLGHACRGCTR